MIDPPVLLGVDLGTQSTRVLAFDVRGRLLVTARRPTPSRIGDGTAEYDPDLLWATVEACLGEAVAELPSGVPVAGLAVASVGEACVLVDAAGRATAPALVWYDRRTQEWARRIEARLGPDRIFAITGQRSEPTLGLSKLLWMRENWPDAFGRAVRVLNVADWIAFRLSGVPATDFTLASRTLALDLHGRCWSSAILDAFGLAPDMFAPLRPSGFGLGPVRPSLAAALGLHGAPVVATGGHDHLCGMFAAGAARPGAVLDSMGTAEAILYAIAAPSNDPALLDLGYSQGRVEADRQLVYVGTGLNSCGGAIEWFRRLFASGVPYRDLIAEAAATPPGSRGVHFLPHLAYAPPPRPDAAARGAFVGLTVESDRGDLFRAILEGLAHEGRLMLDGMGGLAEMPSPEEIRVIGGNSRNDLFMEIKASVLGRPLTVVEQPEATALGAAILGGLGAGVWPDLATALTGIDQPTHVVAPTPDWTALYDRRHAQVHTGLHPALRETNRGLAG